MQLLGQRKDVQHETGCSYLPAIVEEIEPSVRQEEADRYADLDPAGQERVVNEVARRNVHRAIDEILARSSATRIAAEAGRIMVVGAMYDVRTGEINFFHDEQPDRELAVG
jgi:carbonic anhydrase/SulP family sulfate permease